MKQVPVPLVAPAGDLQRPQREQPRRTYRALQVCALRESRADLVVMFGEDRLHRAIAAACSGTPASLVAAVMGEVEYFAAGAPPEDDLTLLAIRYSGASV